MKSVFKSIVSVLAMTLVCASHVALAAPQCASFEIVPTPNPGGASNALVAVAAVGDGTAWAVGSKSDNGATAMILHYDGTQWNEVPLPAEAEGIFFSTAGNTPDGDVWMIGTRTYSVYQVEVFCLRARGGVIDRVDSFLNGGAPLDISATSANDVWAVSGGLWPVDQGGYVQHFDGTEWTIMQLPTVFTYRNDPQSIYAAGPDNVWIVGEGGDHRGDYPSYVQHWDGSSWESVSTPYDGQQLVFFQSIDGSSADDIWVAGHVNWSTDVLMHWNGSSWTQHFGPDAGEPLNNVVVSAADNSWAAPYSLTPGTPFYYWDGATWSDAGAPNVPGAVTVNWRDLSQGGACDVWAIGSYHDGVTTQTLVARIAVTGSGTSGVGESGPRAAVLLGNHPNPFNPSTVISFELAAPQAAELAIYTIDGRLVRTLLSGVMDAGVHNVTWDGRDDAGRPAASGTYLYRVRHEGGVLSGKMALTK